MSIARRTLVVFLLGLIFAGCMAMPTGGEPAATAVEAEPLPEPVEIRLVNGEREEILLPADEEFATTVAALWPMLSTISEQVRTFFSPDRFAEEVETVEHVYIRFEDDEKFDGQEISWIASELIVAQIGSEAMLLARPTNTVDWSVYLPADPANIEEFLGTLFDR